MGKNIKTTPFDIVDKQFLMAQKILILLEQNQCNYRDWQFIDGLVNAVVNEQKNQQLIKYMGAPVHYESR